MGVGVRVGVGVGVGVGDGVGVGVAVGVGVGVGEGVGTAVSALATAASTVAWMSGVAVGVGVGAGVVAVGAVSVGVGGVDWQEARTRSVKARRTGVRKGGASGQGCPECNSVIGSERRRPRFVVFSTDNCSEPARPLAVVPVGTGSSSALYSMLWRSGAGLFTAAHVAPSATLAGPLGQVWRTPGGGDAEHAFQER